MNKNNNVIIGLNGSGKTNLIESLQFLFDIDIDVQPDTILHNNADSQTSSAYVEIILDNSDKRVPVSNYKYIWLFTIKIFIQL